MAARSITTKPSKTTADLFEMSSGRVLLTAKYTLRRGGVYRIKFQILWALVNHTFKAAKSVGDEKPEQQSLNKSAKVTLFCSILLIGLLPQGFSFISDE